MKYIFTLLLLLFFNSRHLSAQANFQCHASGNWNDAATWTLSSGNSSTGYPVAGDDVSIGTAYSVTVNVNSQCGSLTINGAAQLLCNSTTSFLTVAGTVTQSAGATITISQGALTIVGVMVMLPPVPPATGNTLLDVQGGAFSCAGGMSMSGTTTTRSTELRIGSSLVNIVGGLSTVTLNARINFSGPGTLTLAGAISIQNAASFTAGNGRVVYVGIPGSDQVVAPLKYNRLVITGAGSGSKKINGTVEVTDTLTLLTDTLVINGGTLTLDSAATIVRTGGKLLSAPLFKGSVDIVYNDIAKDTTGSEVPVAAGILHDLTISNGAGIQLGNNVTVNNGLHLLQGPLITGVYDLTVANPACSAVTDSAIEYTNGYVLGALTRNIDARIGIRNFPLGVANIQGFRQMGITYTVAPVAPGTLRVQHFDTAPAAQSGLPLTDGTVTIVNVAPMYWQADALNGLAGGSYTATLTAEGIPGVSDISTLRIIKRASTGGAWMLNGTAGTNTGTTTAPVVERQGMSGFSQFTIGSNTGNPLPVTLLYFSGAVTGKNAMLKWATAMEANSRSFILERSMNGYDFYSLATIPAAGSSTQQVNYTYMDNTLASMNYYRLKQVDVDGRYTYSDIVRLSAFGGKSIKLYPVPASNSINISTVAGTVLGIYNAAGQFIQLAMAGTNDIGKLAAGAYYVVGNGESLRFIKQ